MLTAADLSVVIPTRNRWDILAMTLDGLRRQTVQGHEVIVVVNGRDQQPPPLPGVRVIPNEDAGPGAGRNVGAAQSDRALIMFLGDDTIPEPDLVEKHLDAHQRHSADSDAVLGLVQWHKDVADNPINRWLDWSRTQFDYDLFVDLADQDVGYGRLFASNLSLKRSFFESVGGFDTDFYFGYEDTDLGLRMHQRGLKLFFEPQALVQHLHGYSWEAIAGRFKGVAATERLMCHKHPEMEPFFLQRCQAAMDWHKVRRVKRFVEIVPDRLPKLQAKVRAHANASYYRALAPEYLRRYDAAEALCDLVDHLGSAFNPMYLNHADLAPTDVQELYRWTSLALAAAHGPALDLIEAQLAAGAPVLVDPGADGSDGLTLARAGFDVTLASGSDLTMNYLRGRFERHGQSATFVPRPRPTMRYAAALCLDHLEIMSHPEDVLASLEAAADLIVVNAPQRAEHGMNAEELVRHLAGREVVATTSDRSGRTVVAYRSGRATTQ